MPTWWVTYGVLNTNALDMINDYAAVNQGQLKWIALQAYSAMTSKYGEVSSTISNRIGSFTSDDNYQAVNLGQLKWLAKPFYDDLQRSYPWRETNTNDYAVANIGQVKNAFSF